MILRMRFWLLFHIHIAIALQADSFLQLHWRRDPCLIRRHTFLRSTPSSENFQRESNYEAVGKRVVATSRFDVDDEVEPLHDDGDGDESTRADYFSKATPEDTGKAPSVAQTRLALGKLIDDSWEKVSQLVPASTLELCKEELRSATSLLVLATIRRAADDSPISRVTVQSMFQEADVNGDGQLTFKEWLRWLGGGRSDTVSVGAQSFDPTANIDILGVDDVAVDDVSIESDPIISALGLVLSSAVSTLKTVARMQIGAGAGAGVNQLDPSLLSSAFIAGGAIAGVLDADICQTMLSRLSPKTR
jgi:EF hand